MKLANAFVQGETHVLVWGQFGPVDATAAGLTADMEQLIAGQYRAELMKIAEDPRLPVMDEKELCFANIVEHPGKLLCVGLNYLAHAENAGASVPSTPTLFCKFPESLVSHGAAVRLMPWEVSYDYEAELVIVIGKKLYHADEQSAKEGIFGYTCGNDLSCREAQMRTTQWLIGKAWPDSGPCGPWIVTCDEFDPNSSHAVRSFVNGELRQNGNTSQMIFRCAELVRYISDYIPLCPGDLIFTGTPSGVIVERKPEERVWLRPGDEITVEIEGIGTLKNVLTV